MDTLRGARPDKSQAPNVLPCEQGMRLATPADALRFSALELQVIHCAERIDATREPPSRGILARVGAFLFGMRAAPPLADPRLECLRRFSSLVRHHCDCVVEADVLRLIDAGFSTGQAYGLLDHLNQRCRGS